MANTLLTPSILAKEGVLIFENEMVMAGLVHRDFDRDFAGGKVGDTITVRKPATFIAQEYNGSTIDIQYATEGSVAVKLDTILDVSWELTSKEMSLSVEDFSEQFLQPAMRAHAQAVDAKLASLYADIPYNFSISNTPAISDMAALDRILNVQKAPQADRRLVLSPAGKAGYITLDPILHSEKAGSTDALRRASMGQIMGLDTYMDQNIVLHTKGDLAAAAALSGSVGATTGTIASGGNAKKIKKGDLFTISGLTESAPANQFVCTKELTTLSDGTGTLEFYPALPSSVSGAQITVLASKAANLAFHKNAFALVTRSLAKPMGGADSEVLTYRGLSLRVTMQYNSDKKADILSVDQLVGVKTLTPELAVRLNG